MVNVLYSNVNNPIIKKQIVDTLATKSKFLYVSKAGMRTEVSFRSTIIPSGNLEQSLCKVEVKRIDVFLWSQEKTDSVIKD